MCTKKKDRSTREREREREMALATLGTTQAAWGRRKKSLLFLSSSRPSSSFSFLPSLLTTTLREKKQREKRTNGRASSSSSSSGFGGDTERRRREEETTRREQRPVGEETRGALEKSDETEEEANAIKCVVDRVKTIEEQEDLSVDYAPVVLRALSDGSDRLIPLHSGNKENSILRVLYSEMKKRVKESKDSMETITYHSWEGRLRAGFRDAAAVVVCQRKEEEDDDDDEDDELTGKEIPTLFSLATTAMKNALEVSDADLENWATWLQITKEENDRDVAHSSSSSSKSKFSIKIEDKSGAIIDTRDWKILRYILRKEMQQKSQKTYDLPNDSEVILGVLVALVKNLPIYATREVLEKYSVSHEWGLTYRRGHSAPNPNLMRRLTFRDGGDLLGENFPAGHSYYIEKLYVMYAHATKFSADAKKNTPKKRKNGPIQYRRELDQLILKRLEVSLFIKKTFDINTNDGNLDDMALYQHSHLQELQNEINEILPFEKRGRGAAKKIIDLEIAVQREDYETAAKLREELRDLNNITWVYLRGNQSNPFD